jgi:endonuclease YncB( thermonuclease family)
MRFARFAVAFGLIFALLAAALIPTGVALAATCGDFPSQAAAQAAYRADPIGLRNLDADGDGIACERNPAPYDFTPVGQPAPQPPSPAPAPPPPPRPQCTFFPETQHNLCGGFRSYWEQFGGLAVFGYPITDEFVDPTTGRVIQWFERARFEWHPGAFPERYDVLLGLLGRELTQGRDAPPFQPAQPIAGCTYFPETQHNLCGGFRAYWEQFGGLAIYGFPISEEFQEVNPDTGQTYIVQYFERQRFEWHPGEWPERFDVMLGRLGVQLYQPPQAALPTPPANLLAATVIEVIDGDTIRVSLDGQVASVRLIGVDTPETVDPNSPVMCYGPEATAFTRDQIARAGNRVLLEKDISETDRYGRLLRYVWLDHPDGRRMLNYELVAQGYAQVVTYPPDVKYADLFLQAQREARDQGRGLWGACEEFGVPIETPTPEPTEPPGGDCHPSYPTVCIPSPPPDLDCPDIPYRRFTVRPPDPHRFDGDGDGIGCESS